MTRAWPPRPTLGRAFYKAHGLGNDYLVFEEGNDWTASPDAVARVCARHEGAGSDGIVALLSGAKPPFRLRMFNPDGSEFERSGNGLRVLGSYLARRGLVGREAFAVEVGGEGVSMQVHDVVGGRYDVSVRMGSARSGAEAIGLDEGALDRAGRLPGPDGEPLDIVPVRVGNPHVVVLGRPLAMSELLRLGPFVAAHPAIPAGANVQLAEPGGAGEMRALVWERGAGHTSASGTSACAVAVAAVARGLTPLGPVRVRMEGGTLDVTVGDELEVTLRGAVEEVLEGTLAPGFVPSGE